MIHSYINIKLSSTGEKQKTPGLVSDRHHRYIFSKDAAAQAAKIQSCSTTNKPPFCIFITTTIVLNEKNQ